MHDKVTYDILIAWFYPVLGREVIPRGEDRGLGMGIPRFIVSIW